MNKNTLFGSDDTLLSLFTGGPVVFLVWKPTQGWPLLYVSPNCEPLFGYDDQRMLQPDFHFADIVHPEDLSRVTDEVQHYMAEHRESWEHRYRIVRSDGEIRWVYDYTRPQRDEQGRLLTIRGYLLDQTEQVRSEQALRESELRWQFALEGAGDGLWDWDARSNKVFFSKQWKSMLGYQEHEIGDTLHEWDSRIHPEDRDRCYEDLKRHFSGETEFYLNEHRVRCKDGSYKWILDRGKVLQRDEKGEPLRVIGTHTDVTSRRQAEDSLRQAETRYRTLHEFLPDGVLLIDPHTALPLEFNSAAHEQLCYTREEFASLRIQDYEVNETPEETEAHIRKLYEAGRDDFETVHRRKDGSNINVMVTVMMVELDGTTMMLAVFRDITDKKQAQEALKQSEHRFREFARSVDVAFWVRTREAMEYVSPGYEKIWGRSCQSLYDNPNSFLESVHPEDKDKVLQAMQEGFQEKGLFNEQYRIIRPDGVVRWVHARSFQLGDGNGQDLRSTGVAHDITERKHAEEALQYSEQRFRDVASAAGEYIWETDTEGQYVYLTERAEEVLGRPVRELIGCSPFQFMLEEDSARVLEYFYQRAQARESFAALEHRSLRPDGQVFWQRVSGLPMFDEKDRLVGYRGVGLDITEAKEAEEALRQSRDELEQRVRERTAELEQTLEELRRAKEQAESASRMKTDFLMNVSHELLTPLNAVQGMLRLIEDSNLEDDQKACLDEVNAAADRLLKIVDNVLVVTRLDKHVPEAATLDLTAVLQSFANTFAPFAREKEIALSTEIAPDCPAVVKSDRHLLQLVLQKLGENALKFTEQGTVSLRISCSEQLDQEVQLCFTLSDTGIGIPADKLPELQQGLVQGESPLTRRFGGLGLGLQAVHKALKLLGGELEVESVPGRGTVVNVRLRSDSCDLENLGSCLLDE